MYLIWDGQIVNANGDPAEVIMYVPVQCLLVSLTLFSTASNDGLPMSRVIPSLMLLSWIELGFLSTSCHSKSHYCSWILNSSPNVSCKQYISRAPEASLLTIVRLRQWNVHFSYFFIIPIRQTSSSNPIGTELNECRWGLARLSRQSHNGSVVPNTWTPPDTPCQSLRVYASSTRHPNCQIKLQCGLQCSSSTASESPQKPFCRLWLR